MANLKGSSFAKQIKNALIRIDARGTKRTGNARFDGLAHSHATLAKRKQLLNDFANYSTNCYYEEKLNKLMTPEIIHGFLIKCVKTMSLSSKENYIANFSALVKGLRFKNIAIPEKTDYEFFQRCKDEMGRPDSKIFKTGRYINQHKKDTMINKLPKRSQVVAEIQFKLGFRASEALEIANHPDKYLIGLNITGVKGKGGQIYPQKFVTKEFAELIQSNISISRSTYYRDQRQALNGENRPHDLRLSYIVNLYDNLRDAGVGHTDSMLKSSKESNHHRTHTTGSYQARR